MKINIYCIGKLKEDYLRAAQKDFSQRIGHYAQLQIHELPEEDARASLSASDTEILLAREAAKISKILKPGKNIALAIDGKHPDSIQFSKQIQNLGETNAAAVVNFIIGGSLGLSSKILDISERLSLSNMTFPHQLARIILLEQIYRSFRIINNQPYHK